MFNPSTNRVINCGKDDLFLFFWNVLLKHKLMSIEECRTARQFQCPNCFAF